MVRLLTMLLISMVVSGYYFPFSFSVLPQLNTKMALAMLGIALVAYQGFQKHRITFSRDLLGAIVFAFIFSFICFVAADYNHTDDYSYVTYFVSFFTWLGGAYVVCYVIRAFHGKATLNLLIAYSAFVCVSQCILAILIDRFSAFRALVDTYISQGQEFFQEVGRLYGIGAALDPAGVRFSIVLLLIVYLLCEDEGVKQVRWKTFACLFAFFVIAVIGNMISRTTSVGLFLGIVYLICSTGIFRLVIKGRYIRLYSILGGMLIVFTMLSVYLYNNDPFFYKNIRFAFEAFFNWVETGELRTDSTDKLNTMMWVWPEDVKSWIIGTGLFANFVYSTDIGYCRFILYCGLIGFGTFVLFFVYNACVFAWKFPSFRLFSFVLLSLSFIIWMKVATDLFFIYALFYRLDWKMEPVLIEE